MDEPAQLLNRKSIQKWWKKHGRLLILVGAFALPLFCSSPLFQPPFADRIAFDSPVGMFYQTLRRMPLLMTGIGFQVWLAWRFGWRPTQARSTQMFVATALALIVLPVFCRGLDLLTAIVHAEDWKSALSLTWNQWMPHSLWMAIAQAGRAGMIFLFLRAAVWSRSATLSEPGQALPSIRPTFSIASLLVATTLIALSIAWLPTLLKQYLWADQLDLLMRVSLGLIAGAMQSAIIAVTIFAVALVGRRSADILIPSLAIVCTVLVIVMYLVSRIRAVLPPAFGDPASFSLLSSIPFAIALVAASAAVFGLFRSLGLELSFRRSG